ncbi:MAG: hypothetical protein U1E10_06850 [Bdellovibrionales bacterium]|nr:hypothetical protein [Bdellovibrionales bacterium]
MKNRKRPSKATFAIAAIAMILGYQNCGEFAVDPSKLTQFASLGSTGSAGAVLTPPTDKYDASCRTNPAYDACVMQQNPIARTGTQLSATPATRLEQLSTEALYGVKLTSLSGNGKLENSTISIDALKSAEVTTTAASMKVAPGASGSSAFEQVNTYYWINRAAEYFDSRSNGALPAKGKNIKVIVDDTVTGFDFAKNTIRLKTSDAGSVAWSGDIAIHLFGVANLMHANPAGWTTLSATKHTTCNAVDKGCCAAAVGCANAIRFGVGEYFAASIFPERTRIGEALVNTGNPQIISGVARDLASLTSNSATATFTTATGFAQSLGLIYASMWWEIRKSSGTQANEIDRIFLEHLTLLDGNDDFRTAFAKAKTVDARLFGGRHSSKFDTQSAARGI